MTPAELLAVFDAYSDVEGTGITQEQHDAARAAVEALVAERDALREALAGMIGIVDDSHGVVGYYLNGEIDEWDEFDVIDAARAALAGAGQ